MLLSTKNTGRALAPPPDFELYCCLCSRMVSTFRRLRVEQLGWAGCCTTSVGLPAGRSLSRSGEDGFSIPTGWFAVASRDTTC